MDNGRTATSAKNLISSRDRFLLGGTGLESEDLFSFFSDPLGDGGWVFSLLSWLFRLFFSFSILRWNN